MITIPKYTGKADETYLRTLTDTLKQIQIAIDKLEDLLKVNGLGPRPELNFSATGAASVTITEDKDNNRINIVIGA